VTDTLCFVCAFSQSRRSNQCSRQYGEHFLDLEDFHALMVQILAKPNGVYSFFNGLAPDNLFFHGVACNCVKLQLASLGLDSEFLPCNISVPNEVWEGIRRKYWHGRETYYLPVCKWNAHFLQTGRTNTDTAETTVGLNDSHIARLQQAKHKVSETKPDQRVTVYAAGCKRLKTLEMN
jgi:hypothetical protein